MENSNGAPNETELETFCSQYGTFTQSALWANVKTGWQAEFLTTKNEDGRVRGSMLVLAKRLPFRQAFLYAPRGPVCDVNDAGALDDLMAQAIGLTEKYNAFMLKIDPMILETDAQAIECLTRLDFVHRAERIGYQNIQCRENYVLALDGKSEEEIFANFKPKWRYNIRLAARKGVQCGFYGEEKLDDFMRLMRQTARHDNFQCRKRAYFERVLRAFGGRAALCMCYLGDRPLSGALCIEYAGVMSYVYGCSSAEHRNCMPNYLMQWTMIRRAVQKRCHSYDFCGIPYWNDKSHPNYGVYRFKQGFGGCVVTYAGEFDYRRRPSVCGLFDAVWLKRRRFYGLTVKLVK